MSRRLLVLEILAAFLLASCGGSSSHSSSATTQSSTSSSPAPATTATSSTTLTGSTASTSAGPGPGTPGSAGAAPKPGQEKIRLPAKFIIHAGGTLSPTTLSAPAFLAVSFSVASNDSRAHRVVVRTPKPHTLRVAPHGRASTLIAGLRPGHYRILIDGKSRGALDIGGEPGP